jgi:hypothetical protein
MKSGAEAGLANSLVNATWIGAKRVDRGVGVPVVLPVDHDMQVVAESIFRLVRGGQDGWVGAFDESCARILDVGGLD